MGQNVKICLIYFLIVIQIGFGQAGCDISQLNLSNLTKSGEVLISCKNPNTEIATEEAGKGDNKCEGTQADGTVIILKCPPFYSGEASLEFEKTCLENGTWSNESEELFCLPECGLIRRPDSQHRPWHVRVLGIIDEIQVDLCSGTLISKLAVLVPAKCLIKNNFGALERMNRSQIVLALAEKSRTRHINVKNVVWSGPSGAPGNESSALVLLELTKEATLENFVYPVCLPSSENVFQAIKFLQPGDSALIVDYKNRESKNLTLTNSAECGGDVNVLKICAKVSSDTTGSHFGEKVNRGLGLTIGSDRHVLFGILSDQGRETGNYFTFTGIVQYIPWMEAFLQNISSTNKLNPSNEDKAVQSKHKTIRMWSFVQDQLRNKDYNSVEIIQQLSYFSNEMIPIGIFVEKFRNETSAGPGNLSHSISLLLNYSLVASETSTNQPNSISILPELQDIVRLYLSENRMEESVIKSALNLLQGQFYGKEVSVFTISHAKMVWRHAKKFEGLVKEYASFHLNIYEQLNLHGKYNDTIELASQNIGLFLKLYGENHNNTIFIQSRVIHARYKLNEFQKAMDETELIYPKGKEILGEDHEIIKYIEENIACMEDEMDGCFTSFCEMDIPDLCLD